MYTFLRRANFGPAAFEPAVPTPMAVICAFSSSQQLNVVQIPSNIKYFTLSITKRVNNIIGKFFYVHIKIACMYGVNACYLHVHFDYSDGVSEEFKESTVSFFKQENPGCSVNICWVKESTALSARRSRERGDYNRSLILSTVQSECYLYLYSSITDSTGGE